MDDLGYPYLWNTLAMSNVYANMMGMMIWFILWVSLNEDYVGSTCTGAFLGVEKLFQWLDITICGGVPKMKVPRNMDGL